MVWVPLLPIKQMYISEAHEETLVVTKKDPPSTTIPLPASPSQFSSVLEKDQETVAEPPVVPDKTPALSDGCELQPLPRQFSLAEYLNSKYWGLPQVSHKSENTEHGTVGSAVGEGVGWGVVGEGVGSGVVGSTVGEWVGSGVVGSDVGRGIGSEVEGSAVGEGVGPGVAGEGVGSLVQLILHCLAQDFRNSAALRLHFLMLFSFIDRRRCTCV